MDIAEMAKVQAERTVEHCLKKIDHIIDTREEEGGHLDRSEVECMKMCWETISHAMQHAHQHE